MLRARAVRAFVLRPSSHPCSPFQGGRISELANSKEQGPEEKLINWPWDAQKAE